MSSQSEALFELLKLTSTLCLEGLLRSSATWNSLRNSILQRGPLQIDAWISGALGGRLGLSNVGPDSISVLRKWIAILGSVAHNVDFPEAVHWLLETLMNADDPSVIGDILKFLIDPTGDEMTDAVLTAANSTTVFGKTVEDFEVTACLLQSFSDSEEHGANGCSEGSMLDDGDALDSFLNSCLISRPVRTKLYHMNDEERSRWLRAIAVAVHHNTGDFDLAQTVNVVAQMAVHHPGLRDSALLSLAIFTESQSTRIHVWKDVQAILNEVLGSHGLSKVGTSCACRLVWSLISQRDDLSSASNVKNPENLIDQAFIAFITRGFKEVDCPWYGTREFVELLCNLDRDGCYDVVITEAVETCFTNEIDNHETRDLWCKLSAPRMKDAHFVGMEAILDSAMTDGQLPGRFQDAITRILEDEQTRTPMLQMLVQRIVDAVRINEEGPGIVSCSHTPLLNLARTIPEDGDVIDERIGALEMIIPILPVEDDAYKSLVLAITEDGLGQWKFAAKDPGTSSRTRKGPDTRTLSMVLSSTISGLFYSGADGMCTMAMKLLLTVVKGRHLLELLQEKEDRELVQRLVDRAVASSNPSIRQGALDVCQSMSLSARFQDVVKSCLTVTIETATEDPHVVKSSEGLKIPGILRVLADLLEGHDTGGHGRCQYTDLFFRIISPSTWHLASIALLAVERAQNDLKNKSQVAQLDTSPAPPDKRRIDEHLVRMIPSILPTMSVGQKRIALDLIEELTLSMPVVHDVVQALHPLLDSNSTLSVRGDAVELMLELHIKYRSREMGSLSYVIPSLIILALDDAGDAGGSRAMALQLLVSLMTQDDKGREAVKGHQRKHAFQTTKFMALLGYRDLRSSLVELLSLMAVDATIRKTISLQVMTVLSSTVEDENYAGHAELLTRMISDKRFADAPIDYVTILFSSAMSSRSSFTTHRYQLVTSLWCHYSTNPFKGASTGTEKEVKGLVEYFVATLFGRHATKAEVDTWIANSERWLKDCVTQGKD